MVVLRKAWEFLSPLLIRRRLNWSLFEDFWDQELKEDSKKTEILAHQERQRHDTDDRFEQYFQEWLATERAKALKVEAELLAAGVRILPEGKLPHNS